MKKKKIKLELNILNIIVFIILLIYAISVLAMLFWGLVTSFKCTLDFSRNLLGFPDIAFFEKMYAETGYYYQYAWEDLRGMNFWRAIQSFQDVKVNDWSYISTIFGFVEKPARKISLGYALANTFVYAVVGSFLFAFTSMTVAYLCAKYKYKYSSFIYVLNLVIMIIPVVGSQPSMIDMMKSFGIFDSYAGMILQKISFAGMYFLVFYAFFKGLSDSYIEAAEIDGASQLSVLLRIVFPLAFKIFGTVFLLTFINLWNDYQTPLLYFPTHSTLSFSIFSVIGLTQSSIGKGNEWQGAPQKIAACMVLAIPMIILFCIFSKKIMGNMSIGGLKE